MKLDPANVLATVFVAFVACSSVKAQVFSTVNSGVETVDFSSAVAADFDGDGKMDLLIEGSDGTLDKFAVSGVWRNTGNFVFTEYADLQGNFGNSAGDTYNGQATAADFFNSGRIDTVLTGTSGNGAVLRTELWHNLGNGNFALITNSGLLPSNNGSVATGDLNNDGLIDLAISGVAVSGFHVRVCQNLGGGVFSNATVGLTGNAQIFIGDFDNDGCLDLLIGGNLLRNRGNGTFTNVPPGFPGSPVAIGDFNNDGYLDVLVANGSYQIWRNLGNGTFTNSNVVLSTVLNGYPPVAVVGDYDNDGWSDIILQTGDYFDPSVQIWRNLGNGTFTNVQSFLGAVQGTLTWGDFNNDGQLDFLMTGWNSQDKNGFFIPIAQMLQNNLNNSNTPPTAPTNLTFQILGHSGVKLNWGAATDDHTPSSGLNYNIRVGTTPGGLDIVSPEADPVTGRRLVVQIGNAQERLFSLLTNLSGGTYYWSVQAIDTAYAGGAFATEATFIVPPSITGASLQTNHQFQVSFNAMSNTSYTLQSSSNLIAWSFVTNVIASAAGPMQMTDTNASAFPRRYYRLSYP